ncbi:hypothetical protein E5D57_009092 [Metarhizium anisopliae]|nr:hypothetical protein E5D57_009092 [Metarhizium anisopliae]
MDARRCREAEQRDQGDVGVDAMVLSQAPSVGWTRLSRYGGREAKETKRENARKWRADGKSIEVPTAKKREREMEEPKIWTAGADTAQSVARKEKLISPVPCSKGKKATWQEATR